MSETPTPVGDDTEYPYVSLLSYPALPSGEDQYPLSFMETYGVLKLIEDDESVSVGLTHVADLAVIQRLKLFHRKPVRVFRLDPEDFASFLARLSSGAGAGLSACDAAGPEGAPADERLLLDRLANDAPVVNLVNSILIDGIRRGASDIHIDAFSLSVSVRYRIDGVLERASTIRTELFAAVSSRIKIMANLNIMERRLPQDGRLSATISGESLDMRVSIVPIAKGESIVLRILGKKGSLFRFSELGFPDEIRTAVTEIMSVPHGLFLVTGPTGSGKTTTLSSLLSEIYSEAKKIVSIEDPVEYLLDGVDQIQTNDRIGLTFESLLRRVLRQDPDVILVGEIRDGATAELAVRAALTGHLVLATLHTNDAPAAVPRLTDMGVPSYLVAAVLRGVLSQRLVRKVCRECSTAYAPDAAEMAFLARYGFAPATLSRGTGCHACSSTGFRGRVAIAELFLNDEHLERLIARGEEAGAVREYLKQTGFKPLISDGIGKALAGVTTLSEVEASGIR